VFTEIIEEGFSNPDHLELNLELENILNNYQKQLQHVKFVRYSEIYV
jgi:hypothetical protein